MSASSPQASLKRHSSNPPSSSPSIVVSASKSPPEIIDLTLPRKRKHPPVLNIPPHLLIDLTGSDSDSDEWNASPITSAESTWFSDSSTMSQDPATIIKYLKAGISKDINDRPSDTLFTDYTPPTTRPFPSGASDDIINSNPELAYIFHIKSVAAEKYRLKAAESTDSDHALPSTLGTSFFRSDLMDKPGLVHLKHDVRLARKIGYLPFRSMDKAREAVQDYNDENYLFWRRSKKPRTDGADDEKVDKDGYPKAEVNKYGDPMALKDDWYPGTSHFKKLARDWFEENPRVREVVQHEDDDEDPPRRYLEGTAVEKDLRSFDWERWEKRVQKAKAASRS